MFMNRNRTILKSIAIVVACLFVQNQLTWPYPAPTLSLRDSALRPGSAAGTEGQKTELAGQMRDVAGQAGGLLKASSSGINFSPESNLEEILAKGGGTGKFESISIEKIDWKGKGKVEVTARVKRLGLKKREKVILFGRKRKDSEEELLDFAKTGESVIDRAVTAFLKENQEIDDIIIESIKFEKGSLLRYVDFGGIGVGASKDGSTRPFRGRLQELSRNRIIRLHEFAHMAHDQGFLTLEQVLSCFEDEKEALEYYENSIRQIKMITGKEAPQPVKFHYALRALQKKIFHREDEILSEWINVIKRSKPNENINEYLSQAIKFEEEAVEYEKSRKHEQAAEYWGQALQHYFTLNMFEEAVKCKERCAEDLKEANWTYYRKGKFKEAIGCLERAAKLYKELGTKNEILAYCRSLLAEWHFRLGEYDQSAEYFERSAKMFEKLGHKREAAMNWAKTAAAYIKLTRYTMGSLRATIREYYKKAAFCDRKCAQLDMEIGEPIMAIEHYVFAAANFEKAELPIKAARCIGEAKRINPGLFKRMEMIRAMLDDEGLDKEAAKELNKFPVLFTLAGFKPVTSQPIRYSFRVGDNIKQMLKKHFNNQVRLVTYKIPSASVTSRPENWYCVYNTEEVRTMVKDTPALFDNRRLQNLTNDKRLDSFMEKFMTADKRRFIFLGYPPQDANDFIRYYSLLDKAGIPSAKFEKLGPNHSSLRDNLLSLREIELDFLRQFYRARLDFKRSRPDYFRKIYLDWISIRPDEKREHIERYIALRTILDVLVLRMQAGDQEVELLDMELPVSAGRISITNQQKVSEAFATQA